MEGENTRCRLTPQGQHKLPEAGLMSSCQEPSVSLSLFPSTRLCLCLRAGARGARAGWGSSQQRAVHCHKMVKLLVFHHEL